MARRYNKQRFRELVIYITAQTADDDTFADTHLNKALFHSDFTAYAQLGDSITGAQYQKLEWGPAATCLLPARRGMVADGLLEVREPTADVMQRITTPRRPPKPQTFTPHELAIIDEVITGLRGKTASQVSAESHRHPGWQLVELTEEIPYATALISTRPAQNEVKELGRSLATRFGW
jgi:hypothetical protein